jgi:hypothetical protein
MTAASVTKLLGVEVHLRSEAATDIRRNHAQQMLRDAHRFGDPAAVHMRHLTGQIDCQPAINSWLGKDAPCLEAGRNETVVDQT